MQYMGQLVTSEGLRSVKALEILNQLLWNQEMSRMLSAPVVRHWKV